MRVILLVALLSASVARAPAATPACPSPSELPPSPFVDLVSSAHRAAITCATWYGLANGRTATRFGPLGAVRRDQMATFLARAVVAANVPLPSEPPQPFTDVAASAHRQAIAQMAVLDLVRGTGEGRFAPEAPVRRDQMAAFLVRLVRHLGVEARAADDAFSDDDGTAHEHEINMAAELGLAEGVGAARFAPGRPVRREQMASFLGRMVEVLADHGVLHRRPIPAFASSVGAVPPQMRDAMAGTASNPGYPVPTDDPVLLTVIHWDFDAEPRRGHLIVARSVVRDVAVAFHRAYAARFQIEHLLPVPTSEGGSCPPATAVARTAGHAPQPRRTPGPGITAAFDCRGRTGGASWAEHSSGSATDTRRLHQHPSVSGR